MLRKKERIKREWITRVIFVVGLLIMMIVLVLFTLRLTGIWW